MREITVYDSTGAPLTDIVQWDKGVTLQIKDSEITAVCPVHFFNKASDLALVVNGTYESGALKAKIPDILLTQPYNIAGYAFVTKNSESRSILGFTLQMIPRKAPSDVVYPGTDDYISVTDVLNECRDLAQKAEASKTGADSAKTAAEAAAKKAQESQTAAAGSASTAQQAAQQAQTAKTGAETAKAGAETAQKAAEKSATDAAASATKAETARQGAEAAKGEAESLLAALKKRVELLESRLYRGICTNDERAITTNDGKCILC